MKPMVDEEGKKIVWGIVESLSGEFGVVVVMDNDTSMTSDSLRCCFGLDVGPAKIVHTEQGPIFTPYDGGTPVSVCSMIAMVFDYSERQPYVLRWYNAIDLCSNPNIGSAGILEIMATEGNQGNPDHLIAMGLPLLRLPEN